MISLEGIVKIIVVAWLPDFSAISVKDFYVLFSEIVRIVNMPVVVEVVI